MSWIKEHSKSVGWVVACTIIGIGSISITAVRYFWELSLDNEKELAFIQTVPAILERIDSNLNIIVEQQTFNDRKISTVDKQVTINTIELKEVKSDVVILQQKVDKLEAGRLK